MPAAVSVSPAVPAFADFQAIVEDLAASLQAPVSSFYRWLPASHVLQLAATHGLNRELVGQLQLRLEQGLTGLVAQTRKPVSVKHPARHPRYLFVPGSYEERLESYLGVPVFLVGRVFAGVVTVQSESPRIFTPTEISRVVMAASRVAQQLAVAGAAQSP